MPATNVELSKNELELVVNSEFILTKNRIVEKVFNLFGALSEDYKVLLQAFEKNLPAEAIASSPKIYRGENYLNLPYVMMDHPRVFIKDDVFAMRSFFWWGNYFSCTLQLSGKYLEQYKNNLHLNLQYILNADYFVCINDSAWHHHFEKENYMPLQQANISAILNRSFFKIAARLPLHEWNEAEAFFTKTYAEFIALLVE